MSTLTRMLAGAVVVAVFPGALAAQPAPLPAFEQFSHLQQELRRSHDGGDTAAYLATAQAMHSFLNGSPRGTLQLMSAETAAGMPDDALRSFAEFVAMGQADEEVLKAKSFDPLRGLPAYQSLYAGMAANAASSSSAKEAFRLESNVLIPEDIDYDPAARRFYVTTVLGKQILRVDMAGRTTLFAAAPDQWPMLAVKVDSRRHVLWATEVALDGFATVAKQDWGRSAILQYDLHSGKLMHRIEGPPKAALGDMALDAHGDAIVSDGEHGGVYRVSGSTRQIERIDGGDFVSPQTPAVLPGGRHLLVPDYVRGIGVLDLGTRQVTWIPSEGKHALAGIDGLYLDGDSLIATQNGTSPERVVRFTVNAPFTRVLSESIVERATPTLGDPTHGVVVGDSFYYIANSGWDRLDDHGVAKPGKALTAPIIMRATIPVLTPPPPVR